MADSILFSSSSTFIYSKFGKWDAVPYIIIEFNSTTTLIEETIIIRYNNTVDIMSNCPAIGRRWCGSNVCITGDWLLHTSSSSNRNRNHKPAQPHRVYKRCFTAFHFIHQRNTTSTQLHIAFNAAAASSGCRCNRAECWQEKREKKKNASEWGQTTTTVKRHFDILLNIYYLIPTTV